MSRIGNNPVSLPEGVSYTFDQSTGMMTVKGPKGELQQEINPDFKLSEEDGTLTVVRPSEQKRHKALHGLYRSLINNMVVGVSEGYVKELELVGVGSVPCEVTELFPMTEYFYNLSLWCCISPKLSVCGFYRLTDVEYYIFWCCKGCKNDMIQLFL